MVLGPISTATTLGAYSARAKPLWAIQAGLVLGSRRSHRLSRQPFVPDLFLTPASPQAHAEAYNLRAIVAPFDASNLQVPGQTFNGFFIGSGFEYQLDFLPGLFVKTEGRAAWYDRKDLRLA